MSTAGLDAAALRPERHSSVRRNKTIGQLIDASLDYYGIKSREDARDLVRRARAHSKLTEAQALAVAQEQTQAVRRKR
jgi:hypothetical protein